MSYQITVGEVLENQDKTFNTGSFSSARPISRPQTRHGWAGESTKSEQLQALRLHRPVHLRVVPAQKQVRVRDGGLKKGQQANEDNFLSFLVGMKARRKVRYQMRLAGEDATTLSEDRRNPQDLADFSLAQLALTKKFMPRTLRYTEANGNIVTWDIPDPQLDAQIPRAMFTQPQTPPGFDLKKMPALNAQQSPAGGIPPRVQRR